VTFNSGALVTEFVSIGAHLAILVSIDSNRRVTLDGANDAGDCCGADA
jgi:hypothetical protein